MPLSTWLKDYLLDCHRPVTTWIRVDETKYVCCKNIGGVLKNRTFSLKNVYKNSPTNNVVHTFVIRKTKAIHSEELKIKL